MSYMFRMTEFPILDLSSFDASNVINIENMFDGCYETEEVYARTVYDAEIFNDRSVTGLPSHLEFVVK